MKTILIALLLALTASCSAQEPDTTTHEVLVLTKSEAKAFKTWLKSMVKEQEKYELRENTRKRWQGLVDSMEATLKSMPGRGVWAQRRDSVIALFLPQIDSLRNEFLKLRDGLNE